MVRKEVPSESQRTSGEVTGHTLLWGRWLIMVLAGYRYWTHFLKNQFFLFLVQVGFKMSPIGYERGISRVPPPNPNLSSPWCSRRTTSPLVSLPGPSGDTRDSASSSEDLGTVRTQAAVTPLPGSNTRPLPGWR